MSTTRRTGRSRDGKRWGKRGAAWDAPLVPGGQDQLHRPGLSGDGPARLRDRCRPTTRRPRSPPVRSSSRPRSRPPPRTSGSSNRSCAPPSAISRRPASPASPARSSPTPATGTNARWNGSSPTAAWCSIPPDGGLRQTPARAGTAASTRSCAACWPPTTAVSSTPCANSASSRCSGRSKPTGAWTASYSEAAPRSASEWRMIAATHNLLKLHQHWIAPPPGDTRPPTGGFAEQAAHRHATRRLFPTASRGSGSLARRRSRLSSLAASVAGWWVHPPLCGWSLSRAFRAGAETLHAGYLRKEAYSFRDRRAPRVAGRRFAQ